MIHVSETDRRAVATDLAYRRRALKVNGGIYARRHGPELVAFLAGNAIRDRLMAEMEWLASEPHWAAADARRVSSLSAEIIRVGRLRPDVGAGCDWHAARLSELVGQYRTLQLLEAKHDRGSVWSAASRATFPPKLARAAGKRGRSLL